MKLTTTTQNTLDAVTQTAVTQTNGDTARRMFELLEPICLVTFFADECNEELAALGHRTAIKDEEVFAAG